ncbi:hypothetical protein bhYOR_001002 (plasmid) [Borrelia nietonii YOR]|nr:hypothetical protein bhYOR_000917 [Borrelia nietonii YOR]UPA09661.1 hypothetical protein bhYOR_001002 [Borrelia nietonii YOR]
MNNLAYKTYKTEDLRIEFLNKGFAEAAVDFILLHNNNFNFEVLREKNKSNIPVLREKIKNNHSVLLEKISVGNIISIVITVIEIPIIIFIIMSLISKFFIG